MPNKLGIAAVVLWYKSGLKNLVREVYLKMLKS